MCLQVWNCNIISLNLMIISSNTNKIAQDSKLKKPAKDYPLITNVLKAKQID